MTSSEILSGLLIVGLFTVMCSGQTSQELSSEDTQLSQHETENELVSIREMKRLFIALFIFLCSVIYFDICGQLAYVNQKLNRLLIGW